MIELLLYRLDLFHRFLGESRGEVTPDDAPPIPYYIIEQRHEHVRECIQHPERQGADSIEKIINDFCH